MSLKEKIETFLKRFDLPYLVASLAEDYIKRFAEAKYDRLAQTRIFQSLKSRSQKEKLVIELGFYSSNAYIKKKMNFNMPDGMFLGGLIADFFPEMGKRLMNGQNSPNPDEQEVIELVRSSSGGENYYEAKNDSSFFGMNREDLNRWLKESLERKRRKRHG